SVGERGSAVVGQRFQTRIDWRGSRAHLVTKKIICEAAARVTDADEVVAHAVKDPGEVLLGDAGRRSIAGDDRIRDVDTGKASDSHAAPRVGDVASDCDVSEGQQAEDGAAAARGSGGIAAERDILESCRCKHHETAASTGGAVAVEGGTEDGQL